MEIFAFSSESTMSSTMHTALVPADVVNDQPSMKSSIKAKEVVIKINSETEEYELAKQKKAKKLFVSSLVSMLIAGASGFLLSFIYAVTLAKLKNWQKQTVNHTCIEQFKTDSFQIQIIMNVYMVITAITLFFFDVNFMTHFGFPRVWKQWLATYTAMFTIVYLTTLMLVYVLPISPQPLPIAGSAQDEYGTYKLSKLYFYFQLAGTWFMFQSIVGFIIVSWISDEEIKIKSDKTPSSTTKIQKTKVYPQSEKKPQAISHY